MTKSNIFIPMICDAGFSNCNHDKGAVDPGG